MSKAASHSPPWWNGQGEQPSPCGRARDFRQCCYWDHLQHSSHDVWVGHLCSRWYQCKGSRSSWLSLYNFIRIWTPGSSSPLTSSISKSQHLRCHWTIPSLSSLLHHQFQSFFCIKACPTIEEPVSRFRCCDGEILWDGSCRPRACRWLTKVFYLPMHTVRKEHSTTTKIRAVFDTSAKSSTGVSLNDTLLVGPTVHPTLINVLLRFRFYRVALTADVSKTIELHGVSDVLELAYAAVVYLRLTTSDHDIQISLVTSKTKVAPSSGWPYFVLNCVEFIYWLVFITMSDKY